MKSPACCESGAFNVPAETFDIGIYLTVSGYINHLLRGGA